MTVVASHSRRMLSSSSTVLKTLITGVSSASIVDFGRMLGSDIVEAHCIDMSGLRDAVGWRGREIEDQELQKEAKIYMRVPRRNPFTW